MKQLLLDTNIVLAVANGFNLVQELEEHYPEHTPTILAGTLQELEALQRKGTRAERAAARMAEQLIQRQHLNIVGQSDEHVDDALITQAQKAGGPVATLDKELQKRLEQAGIQVLTIKRRKLLRPLKE